MTQTKEWVSFKFIEDNEDTVTVLVKFQGGKVYKGIIRYQEKKDKRK